MVATITLLCLVACPSDPPPLIQSVNEEWRTHTADPFLESGFTLDAYQLPTRRPSTPRSTPTPEPTPPTHSTGVEQWRPLLPGARRFGLFGSSKNDNLPLAAAAVVTFSADSTKVGGVTGVSTLTEGNNVIDFSGAGSAVRTVDLAEVSIPRQDQKAKLGPPPVVNRVGHGVSPGESSGEVTRL